MLSKSSKYAMKAVIYLAQHSSEHNKILVRDMYQRINVSESYLAKLLQHLSRHGLVSSTKGRGGGFYLTEANRKNTMLDVLHAIDGKDLTNACLLGISECNESKPCAVHHLMGPAKTAFMNSLGAISFSDLDIPDAKSYAFPK